MAKSDAANPSVSDEIDSALGGSGELDGALDEALAGAGAPPQEASWDLDECEISKSVLRVFRPITNGWRDYEIVEAEPGFSKAGNRQIVFLFKCLADDEANGVTVEDYAVVDPKSPKAHFKIKMVAKAVGLLAENGTIKPGTKAANFLGLKLAIYTKLDTEYDADNPRAKSADFAPVGYRG